MSEQERVRPEMLSDQTERIEEKEIVSYSSVPVKSALSLAAALLFVSLALGFFQGKYAATLTLISTSIFLEALLAAGASVGLGFDPLTGALIATLANLIPIPLFLAFLDRLVEKWRWLNKMAKKAEARSKKYEKYGVWILGVIGPWTGSNFAAIVGAALRWNPFLIFLSVAIGDFVTCLITTFGGNWLLDWL